MEEDSKMNHDQDSANETGGKRDNMFKEVNEYHDKLWKLKNKVDR